MDIAMKEQEHSAEKEFGGILEDKEHLKTFVNRFEKQEEEFLSLRKELFEEGETKFATCNIECALPIRAVLVE